MSVCTKLDPVFVLFVTGLKEGLVGTAELTVNDELIGGGTLKVTASELRLNNELNAISGLTVG
jgi:hypothetical protein